MQLVFQKLANIFEKNRNLSLTSNQKLAMTDQKQHAESRNIVSKELHHQKRSLSSNVLGKNQMTSYCNAPYMDAKSHRSDHKEGFDQGAFVSMFAYQTLDDRRRQKTKGLTPVDSAIRLLTAGCSWSGCENNFGRPPQAKNQRPNAGGLDPETR